MANKEYHSFKEFFSLCSVDVPCQRVDLFGRIVAFLGTRMIRFKLSQLYEKISKDIIPDLQYSEQKSSEIPLSNSNLGL